MFRDARNGTLDPVSNEETWADTIQSFDDETGEPLNANLFTEITINVRYPNSDSNALTGSLSGGEIVQVGAAADGTFEFEFLDISALDAQTYEVGILATGTNGRVTQVFLGYLPVLNGL